MIVGTVEVVGSRKVRGEYEWDLAISILPLFLEPCCYLEVNPSSFPRSLAFVEIELLLFSLLPGSAGSLTIYSTHAGKISHDAAPLNCFQFSGSR